MNSKLNIIENIFSVFYDREDCRMVIKIFGLRIKFAGKELLDNKFQKFKDKGGKITETPKADGPLRIVQLANYQLLKEVDKFCQNNNLKLWLTFGTLLGAVRHKGFVPWDDDIDVEMLRDDYNKLIELINNQSDNLNFYTELIHHVKDTNIFLKIRHKQINNIFIDVFPVDELQGKNSRVQRISLSNKIKWYRHLMNFQIKKYLKADKKFELLNYIEQKRNKIFKFNTNLKTDDSDLMWGLEYEHKKHKLLCFPRTVYFPLKKIAFEDGEFYCPNKTEEFLNEVFGQYMNWPPKLYAHHYRFNKDKSLKDYFGEDQFLEISKFLKIDEKTLEKLH